MAETNYPLRDRLREICLALPEAVENPWNEPITTFQVRGKNFAMYMHDHHGDGRIALWAKAAAGEQEALIGSDPERFFRPPYVGPRGWIGLRLDRDPLDWEEVRELVIDSYRLIAPKRLAAQV